MIDGWMIDGQAGRWTDRQITIEIHFIRLAQVILDTGKDKIRQTSRLEIQVRVDIVVLSPKSTYWKLRQGLYILVLRKNCLVLALKAFN